MNTLLVQILTIAPLGPDRETLSTPSYGVTPRKCGLRGGAATTAAQVGYEGVQLFFVVLHV